MGVKRLHFRNQIDFKSIPRSRFILSLALGLGATIVFWAFLVLLAELTHYVHFALSYNMPIQVDPKVKEKIFFVLAGIATLVGNSVFISFLFRVNYSSQITRRFSRRISESILNEQSFLTPNFIHFAFKLSFITAGILFYYYSYGLLSHFSSFFALFWAVLYFEGVKTLSKHLGRRRYFLIPLNILCLLLLAFGLSKVQLANFNTIETNYEAHHPHADVPYFDFEVNNDAEISWHRRAPLKLIERDGDPQYFYDKSYKVGEIEEIIINISTNQRRRHRKPELMLYVDRNIGMDVINAFEETCLRLSIPRVYYVFRDTGWEHHWTDQYIAKGLRFSKDFWLNNPMVPLPVPPVIDYDELLKDKTVIDLSFYDGKLQSGDEVLTKQELPDFFSTHIRQGNWINFKFSDDLIFQEYLEVVAYYQKTLYDLRAEEMNPLSHKWSDTWYDEKRAAKNKYPYLWLENYEF